MTGAMPRKGVCTELYGAASGERGMSVNDGIRVLRRGGLVHLVCMI
jgi:hypothetical protein